MRLFISLSLVVLFGFVLQVEATHAQSFLGPVPTISEMVEAGLPENEGGLFGPVPCLQSDGTYTVSC